MERLIQFLHTKLKYEINAQALVVEDIGAMIEAYSPYNNHRLYVTPYYKHVSVDHRHGTTYLEHTQFEYDDPELISQIIKYF